MVPVLGLVCLMTARDTYEFYAPGDDLGGEDIARRFSPAAGEALRETMSGGAS